MKGFAKITGSAFSLLLTAMLIFSCNKPEPKKPDYILSQEDMVRALTEIYIAEQKLGRMSLNADSAALVFGTMEKKIFENLNIPDSVFRASVDYYMDHPKEMETIYAVLIDSLQLREQRAPQQLIQ